MISYDIFSDLLHSIWQSLGPYIVLWMILFHCFQWLSTSSFWRRKWQLTPVFLPGKSREWRILVGYSPWCHKESDMTEWLTHTHMRAHTHKSILYVYYNGTSQVALVVKNPDVSEGDMRDVGWISGWGRSPGRGHGNPHQYSCLENPMDSGAWQATLHRITQSWTQQSNLACMQYSIVYM